LSTRRKSRARFKLLVDTKPLYSIIAVQLGLKKNLEYGEELLRRIEAMKLPLASTWPVFTETLYFIYRDLKKRKDFDSKLEEAKKALKHIKELYISFHTALDKITRDFDIADTALLTLAKKKHATILSEDYRLVEKARSMGIPALTPHELLSIAVKNEYSTIDTQNTRNPPPL